VELDRRYITRRDFPAARRGYDPDEVDAHLRELADAVDDIRRQADEVAQRPAPTATVAGAAAEQVRTIVEAAERSAGEIEQRAEAEAGQTRSDAQADARATREQAAAEAAEHVRRVEDATRAMLDRAGAAESQVDALIDDLRGTTERVIEGLRTSADGMIADLRNGAEGLGRELEEIRRSLGDVRGARDAAAATAPPPAPREEAPPPAPEPDYAPEPAYEPAPAYEPEPAYEAETPDYDRPHVESESLKIQGDELHPADLHAPDTSGDEILPPAAPEREPYQPEAEELPDMAPADVGRDTRESVEEAAESAPQQSGAASGGGGGGSEGARLIALNMALNGSPREETAAYLAQNFDLPDQDALLDEVYSRAGG
jgi:DivIVA domain-containing protein